MLFLFQNVSVWNPWLLSAVENDNNMHVRDGPLFFWRGGGWGGGVEKFPNANFFCNYSYSNDFIFQGNFAANNCFSTFISWICDFATAFNNAWLRSHCFYICFIRFHLVFLLPSHFCLQFQARRHGGGRGCNGCERTPPPIPPAEKVRLERSKDKRTRKKERQRWIFSCNLSTHAAFHSVENRPEVVDHL